jgi:glycosyltransferase involved in cell wall biosynthesis
MLEYDMPKISAVMALYNTPFSYLDVTVKSILNQSFTDFEFIIIDDASTIDYKSYFESFNDNRIKYFKLDKNSGPAKTRNEGIKKATGDYVAIVDSDDVYMPERFELQSDFLDSNPDISLISGNFRQSNRKKANSVITTDEEIKIFLLFNAPIANPLVMFRRKIFVEENLFFPEDTPFGEDYSLWINCLFRGIKMGNIDKVLMIYTRRKKQLSKMDKTNQKEHLKNIYKSLLENLGMNPSEGELELHYNIEVKNFAKVENEQVIIDWFNKIIAQNRLKPTFNEELLEKEKTKIIENYNKRKKNIFRIKIGNYNLVINKNLKVSLQKRD